MGVFDTVLIDDAVTLPVFPDSHNAGDISWQTKQIAPPLMQTYRLTADGRLLRRETEERERTPEELDERAATAGYESWAAWEATAGDEPLELRRYTTDESVWVDHNMHGAFEFHASGKRIEGLDDTLWSYEARFTRGDLDEILCLSDAP